MWGLLPWPSGTKQSEGRYVEMAAAGTNALVLALRCNFLPLML